LEVSELLPFTRTDILKPLIFVFLIFISFQANSQTSDSLGKFYFAGAKKAIEEKRFDDANLLLRKLISLKSVMADEVAYYYGWTLLENHKYVKAKEALLKYIDLTGKKGAYYDSAQAFLERAEANICKKCNNTGLREITDTCMACRGIGTSSEDCDVCHKKGIEICPACEGRGVIIYSTGLGRSYQECRKCEGQGFVECSVCEGTKKKKVKCKTCEGKGLSMSKIPCDHH
jgi:hypothetical protein